MDAIQDDRPLFATQGGGYAVYENGQYLWHSEIPPFVNAQVGDPIPNEWGVEAVNEAALREIEDSLDEEQGLHCTRGCYETGCLGLCVDIIV